MESSLTKHEIKSDNGKLREMIEKWKAKFKLRFVPEQDFYETIGITRKRWAKLLRDEVSITLVELEKVDLHLNTGIITKRRD